MKTFPYFTKLFCSPLMVLASVRSALEMDLLNLVAMPGAPVHSQGSEMPVAAAGNTPARTRGEYGEPGKVDEEWLGSMKVAAETKRAWRIEKIYTRYDDVAVIQIVGVIDKHLSDFDMSCYGGCDLADVDQALAIAASDARVSRVVLCINSPGGSVLGVPETAARVAALAETKEVRTFVDTMCCSAAFYIGSQADRIDVAPSAVVGSVGVYMTLVDATRWAEMEGYKVELIRAGKWKALGSPWKELTDEERAHLQSEVISLHTDFKTAVKTGRGKAGMKVDDAHLEAQVYRGTEAVKVGFADGNTNANLDEYVSQLLLEP